MNNYQHLFKKKHSLKIVIKVGHAHDVGDHLFVINGLYDEGTILRYLFF